MDDKLKFTEQYNAVHEGVGLIDLSANGRIRVSGSEAVMFLNGLITNDIKALPENQWIRAIFPTVQGRLIAVSRVIRLQDEQTPKGSAPTFILDTEESTHQALLKTIERFTMAGDFRVSDITAETAMFSLQGLRAVEIAHNAFGGALDEVIEKGTKQIEWQGNPLTAVRSKHTTEDGFDLIVSRDHSQSLASVLTDAGAVLVGNQALEVLRIEAGIPRFDIDMDETNVVPELDLEDAISYTKGCYVGQEIIIRIKHRGHVAKKLCRLTIEADQLIKPGSTVKTSEGTDIGRVTSAAFSPRLKTIVALGYVRYEHSKPGTDLLVVVDGQNLPASVVA